MTIKEVDTVKDIDKEDNETKERLDVSEIKAIIESLLFIYGQPLTANELKEVIDPTLNIRVVKKCLRDLTLELEKEGRGLKIFHFDEKYQIGTDKKYSEYVERLISPHKKKTLTRSAIETLTIIAYKQPITKIEVEDIRGVNSNAVFETLLNHNLIVSAGTAKKIGNPKLYKTTDNFLKAINIKTLDELPDLEKYKSEQISLLENLKTN